MRPFNCKLLSIAILLASVATAQASIIFSNDFQSDTNGFTPGGSIGTLTRFSLPTDSGGLSSPNQSMWLGRLGYNVAKSGSIDEIVTLNLSGLTAGRQYNVAFDLFIGGSWDGSAFSFGPDSWRFAVDGTRLVDTTFTNGNQGEEYGAFSPQKYSDTTYTSTSGPNFGKFTGADFSFTTGSNLYGLHYATYRFGRGTGNPVLTFTASGPNATLEFARYGNTPDSPDEYWALDNVEVSDTSPSVVPEPNSLCIWGLCALVCSVAARRKRRVS